jgi:lipoyl(octanoyl) transferase
MAGHRLHLKALVEREQKEAYQRCNYLAKEWQDSLWKIELEKAFKVGSPSSVVRRCSPSSVIPLSTPQSEISVVWREKICEWKFEVVDSFDIEREIVCISTYYLDQYLSTRYVDEKLFRLVAITCIYLAIKLHSPKKVALQCIAAMGQGLIHPDHIVAMELSIMQSLDWHLHPPTPLAFIENLFPLISGNNEAFEFSRFLSELSVFAYPFVCFKPSSIAVAASLFAIDHFDLGVEAVESFQELMSGLNLDPYAPDISKCCSLLRQLYKLAIPTDFAVSADELGSNRV